MTTHLPFRAALLAATLLSTPALAQEQPAAASAEDVAALRSELQALRAEITEMKAQQAKAATTPSAPVPSWKGAPQYSDAGSGSAFKPKGTVQMDAGFVSTPNDASGTVAPLIGTYGAGGINTVNLGTNAMFRRVILGAEGSLPGGFGYNVEFQLAQASVGYEDVVLTYQKKGSPLQLKLGYQYPLSSLELMTSGKFTSFTERAGANDAFNYARRLGLAATWADPKQDWSFALGLFGDDVANSNFNRTGWQVSARGVWAPKLGDTQLHLGLNAQHREAPRDAQSMRYRMRPFTQITDQRFLDTGRIAADGDDIFGLELAAQRKSLHFSSEAQWLKVRGYNDATHAFGGNEGTGGTSAFLAGDPTFFSGYAEIGLFLTGETRGYKGGKWDRTKVLKPFDKGGWGAVQVNARLDYTDLQDQVASGALSAGSLNYANGGTQTGYGLSVHWLPTDYLRFIGQYYHVGVQGGPGAVAAFTSVVPDFNKRDYSSDAVTLRAQVDF